MVKYDILGLKNIEIIKDAYELLGKPYPKSHEINWNDEAVWKDMLRSPIGIFQFEGEFAFQMLRQYEPHSIFDMSLEAGAFLNPDGSIAVVVLNRWEEDRQVTLRYHGELADLTLKAHSIQTLLF